METWEAFEEYIKNREQPKFGSNLFRGQGNSQWALETTLERSGERNILFSKYYRTILVVRSQIESFTGQDWGELPNPMTVSETFQEYDKGSLSLDNIGLPFPAYSYMAYLRHHSFPSPLFDWTRSPYVAAYFAFRHAIEGRVAIYLYSERPENFKTSSSSNAQIKLLGPYVKTHPRHFLQQSAYTICLKFQFNSGWHFSPHESVFSLNSPTQDQLWKFTLPASERIKVLKILDIHNLNAFSLFDSEEALMETMALRHIGFKQAPVQPDANDLNNTPA